MTRRLQAIYERGMLRPLEPLPLSEHQEVRVTVCDDENGEWPDTAFLRYLELEADDSVTIEEVRASLSKIPGSMAADFQCERDERS